MHTGAGACIVKHEKLEKDAGNHTLQEFNLQIVNVLQQSKFRKLLWTP